MSLYVFAGFPKCRLNAGGLRRLIEVEEIGALEEDPEVSYSNDGEHRYHMSELCEKDGIGWAWFPENWAFGNGVTVHKTTSEYHGDIVFHEEGGQLKWEKVIEDRSAYEARWAPGTCPQESHVVHLTWCAFQHELLEFAFERLRAIIEDGAAPLSPELYENKAEPGKYQSATRPLTFGKGKHHALLSL